MGTHEAVNKSSTCLKWSNRPVASPRSRKLLSWVTQHTILPMAGKCISCKSVVDGNSDVGAEGIIHHGSGQVLGTCPQE